MNYFRTFFCQFIESLNRAATDCDKIRIKYYTLSLLAQLLTLLTLWALQIYSMKIYFIKNHCY